MNSQHGHGGRGLPFVAHTLDVVQYLPPLDVANLGRKSNLGKYLLHPNHQDHHQYILFNLLDRYGSQLRNARGPAVLGTLEMIPVPQAMGNLGVSYTACRT